MDYGAGILRDPLWFSMAAFAMSAAAGGNDFPGFNGSDRSRSDPGSRAASPMTAGTMTTTAMMTTADRRAIRIQDMGATARAAGGFRTKM